MSKNKKLLKGFMGSEFNSDIDPDEWKSWRWIMPVVDKIENLKNENGHKYTVIIERDNIQITINGKYVIHVTGNGLISKLEATFRAIIEFIEWYNTETSVI